MCEWLSHGEWCDVRLLCGGRSFNAHRAVLASVSAFLRRILLSSPADETPTFIVLPDFDLEAMSSVLYYIYNGEVIVQKHKLVLFLDIIQAMQIYIDCQYLPNILEYVHDGRFDFNTFKDSYNMKTELFSLGIEDDNDQTFINIKRGVEMQGLLQYSQSEPDFQDNAIQCQNGSELRKSRLGNQKSPYGDRQRNSFLRDLFIETYPRNGNVNGLTEGVLAISNECYRPLASVLSTNANAEHLSGNNAFPTFSKNTNRGNLNKTALSHSGQWLQSVNDNMGTYGQPLNNNNSCQKIPFDISGVSVVGNKGATAKSTHEQISLLPPQLSYASMVPGVHTNSLDFRKSLLEAMKCNLIEDPGRPKLHLPYNSSLCVEKNQNSKLQSTTKVIYNQVLENPWNPRKPNNYRPFRRKDENIIETKYEIPKIDVIINDNNNNIETSTATATESLSERLSFETIEAPESSSPVATSRDSFKCTHCDQVFTNSDSLAVHMRRHLTSARYTCGECGKTFSQLRNFKYHMSIHRGTREFAATCTVCGKYFNDRGYLSSHMKIHRNRKEYKCTLCPKSFNQRVAYNMHVRIHTGVKPHVCAECGKAFSRKMLLKQHARTHSGERPYACPHCDKRFADRSNMTLHLRLHTGVKPFSCTMCPKSFTKKHHLKSHLNFHTGSKPYSCPRCKLAFTQSSNMRTHLKKCSAPEPSSGNESQSNM